MCIFNLDEKFVISMNFKFKLKTLISYHITPPFTVQIQHQKLLGQFTFKINYNKR